VEVRGDWAFFKEVFNFPGWREKGMCCWRCRCTLAEIRQTGLDAAWRSAKLGHWDLMSVILRRRGKISPLFKAPWLTSEQFKMDWLHCADHGVTASFLGNIFWLLLKRMPGNNKAERIASLWDPCISTLYFQPKEHNA